MITVYGANQTLDDLREIVIATPEAAGRRWNPIAHADLVDTVKDECSTRGWRVTEERFATARDGADLAGVFMLEDVKGVKVPKGQSLCVGFLHSNARRRALQITVGTEVAVCNNGMCSGSILLNRVHDHTVDLAEEVEIALDQYTDHAKRLAAGVQCLRERELSPGEAGDILLQAGRQKLIGWTAVGRVDAEYRNPTFSDHGKNNSWALLNAFTYAARRNINPVNQMTTYNDFRKLLPVAEVGLN